jgi:hypothetical protein
MEIPLDLERRLERRWAARFLRTKRIGLKGRINQVPRPATAQYPLGRPQRKEAEALSNGLIGHFVRNDLAR